MLTCWGDVEELNELGASEKGGHSASFGGRGWFCELDEDAVKAWSFVNVDQKVRWVVADETEGHGCSARWAGLLPEKTCLGYDFYDAKTEGVSWGGEGGCVEASASEMVGLGLVRGGEGNERFDASGGERGCDRCVGEGWRHERGEMDRGGGEEKVAEPRGGEGGEERAKCGTDVER